MPKRQRKSTHVVATRNELAPVIAEQPEGSEKASSKTGAIIVIDDIDESANISQLTGTNKESTGAH